MLSNNFPVLPELLKLIRIELVMITLLDTLSSYDIFKNYIKNLYCVSVHTVYDCVCVCVCVYFLVHMLMCTYIVNSISSATILFYF